jgi:hypothetical protein
MRRREFIAGLASAAARPAVARVVSAQAYPSRPCADGAQTQTKWHRHIWRIVHG